jgi:hypothetical protein
VLSLGVVGPKQAIELGQNTFILYYTAKSKIVFTPIKFSSQQRLGFCYPVTDKRAAK